MKKILFCFAVFVLSAVTSFGWGANGHKAIAEAALTLLENPKARLEVSNLLANSTIFEVTDIDSAATWPDDIRQSAHPGKYVNTQAGKSFNTRFHNNRVWHFVDYPLDGVYDTNGHFSASNDVVHILDHCIDVLEDKAADNWTNMSKEEALVWMIHLVGDIHQPLHTGEGFYRFAGDEAELITDPLDAVGKTDDGGGNSLIFGSKNFHSFWDDDMVAAVTPKGKTLSSGLVEGVRNGHFAKNPGNPRDWPAAWATDSIAQAKTAYGGIVIESKDAKDAAKIDISISTADYKQRYASIALGQLTKAAFNLKELLDNINWQ